MTSTKNRLSSLNPEADSKHQDEIKMMESMKGKIARQIEKEMEYWPVSEWLKQVPGIGPYVGGNLILLYYYRFMPVCECGGILVKKEKKDEDEHGGYICSVCEKKAKGEGLLKHKIEIKDFPKISSWWHYLGQHNGSDGRMPRKKKGVVCDWSSKGRGITFQISESFNKQSPDHPYKAFLLMRKKKREQTHPDASAGLRHKMASRETSKLFLAHFWTVCRTLDGLPVTQPYAGTILGHTGIIDPYYFKNVA